MNVNKTGLGENAAFELCLLSKSIKTGFGAQNPPKIVIFADTALFLEANMSNYVLASYFNRFLHLKKIIPPYRASKPMRGVIFSIFCSKVTARPHEPRDILTRSS